MTPEQATQVIALLTDIYDVLYNIAGFTLFTAVTIISFGFFRGIKWVWDQLW